MNVGALVIDDGSRNITIFNCKSTAKSAAGSRLIHFFQLHALSHGQQLARLAPTHLTVPSGQRRALRYDVAGSAPVLEVKLQEMFGLAETPRIARGRVPILLHLLSPRQIPIQVTQDLRGFWERTYPEVKKELKGRYPRHPWPDDPWTATATHRAKPRGS